MNSVLSKTKKSAPPTRTIQGEMKKCQKASRFSSFTASKNRKNRRASFRINKASC